MRAVTALTAAIVVLAAVSIAIRNEGDGFAANAWAWATTSTTSPTAGPSDPEVPPALPDTPTMPSEPAEPGEACTAWEAGDRTGRLRRVGIERTGPTPPGAVRVAVDVEEGVRVDPGCFAAVVHATLSDERGWIADGLHTFALVDDRPAFAVTLASPETMARLCAPLATDEREACWNGSRAVLDANLWVGGSVGFQDPARARTHQLNHAIGLALGLEETACPGNGLLAPVMMRQANGADPCLPNPWPAGADF